MSTTPNGWRRCQAVSPWRTRSMHSGSASWPDATNGIGRSQSYGPGSRPSSNCSRQITTRSGTRPEPRMARVCCFDESKFAKEIRMSDYDIRQVERRVDDVAYDVSQLQD